ncbi:hypothetical protein [Collimonas humicola]|uniref:hypothetical protein n=1 Tax=Collimonas humicola TaxID=2825886 RepID=UPI001B8BAFA6|nr:hypothetical protein [Collimonas humicola]
MMNKKEIKNKVSDLLSSDASKTDVFNKLSGQGVKDSDLAYLIASYADPHRCGANKIYVRILLVITYLQVCLGFLVGFSIGMQIGRTASWVIGALIAFFMLWFAWGFHKNKVAFYNATILLTIAQFGNQVSGFAKAPIETLIAIAIGIGLCAYTWYVRQKIFPDFAFMNAKKVNGAYFFTD